MSQSQAQKTISVPEIASIFAFVATAILCLFIASGSVDSGYSFHVYLFAAGSIAAVFMIANRYMERPASIPQEIDGKPNYNMGPVKFGIVASVFWGVAGFTVGLIIASQLVAAHPATGEAFEMNAIAAVVLGGTSLAGGRGGIGGTLIGAFVIGVLSDGLVMMGVSSFWQMVIKGLVIVVAVIIDQMQARMQARIALQKQQELG